MAIVKPEQMNFSGKNIIMIISGLPGVGKACADDTRVLTNMGFIPISELHEGSMVYGEDGKQHRVLGVYPQGIRPSYRVTFNDGTSIVCDEEHVWTVEAAYGNSKKLGYRPFTVKQLLEKGIFNNSPSRASTNRKPIMKWKIPITAPIERTPQQYYIEPYIMGVLLGDGCLSGGKPIFSNPEMDIEIKEWVERLLMPGYTLTRHEGNCPAYYIKSPNNDNKYAQAMKLSGIDVCSSKKHVPYAYYYGSSEQRLELLRGLMDTDGSASKNRISFSTMSLQLAKDVVFLVQSLGGIAKIHTYDRSKEEKGIEYDVNVRINVCPFLLKRKAAEWEPAIISRYIEKIEKVDDVSCTCIMVDNPSSLFVLENFIVTHNTTLALSAPDVVLIDTDEGLARVTPAHRKDSSICKTYEELIDDIKKMDGVYKTVVIDTAGALLDLMKDWAIRTDTKASKSSGGFSIQGFGIIKQEFLRLSAELRKNFNVIYLFHEAIEKKEEDFYYSLVCEGSARTLVWQPADLGAHLFIQNGKRYLGFSPTSQYTAKSAYGIKGLVEVPELKEGDKNEFLTKIFEIVRKNLEVESKEFEPKKEAYAEAIKIGKEVISNINGIDDIAEAQKALQAIVHALTSKAELNTHFKSRLTELNIAWNKEKKEYEQG